MVHDNLGHNGTHRTYTLLKRLHYWKGLKPSVAKHIKMCYHCQRRNKQVVKYATLHFDMATFPMQFISMDLIDEFHPPTTNKNRYALTVSCSKYLLLEKIINLSYMYAYRLCILCSLKN